MTIRNAVVDDCKLLWEWANDPDARTSAFNSDPISWTGHQEWFARKLKDSNCYIFVGMNEHEPIGQVRFDTIAPQEAHVDVTIDKKMRGKRYGSCLIDMGMNEIFRTTSIRAVHAYIKADNIYSIRAFERAGFRKIGPESYQGHSAMHYLRERDHTFKEV